jgi:hypothetical protein
MWSFETVFMDYLQVWVRGVMRSIDPDPVDVEVIPGAERPGMPGINRVLHESPWMKYRA